MKRNVHSGIKRSGNSSRGRHFCRTMKDSEPVRFEGGMCLSGRFSGGVLYLINALSVNLMTML